MPVVRLRGQLKQYAGGETEHLVAGDTVEAALRGLESVQPALKGWVLDERGAVRRHINVFVNGEEADLETRVGDDAQIEVLPAISGGAR